MPCRTKFNFYLLQLDSFSFGRWLYNYYHNYFLKNFDVAMNASVDVSIQVFCAFFVYMFLLLSGVEFLGHVSQIHLYSYYFAWLL